jgi:hypothetical protein
MTSPFVSSQAQRNRLEIRDLMAEHGFVAYPYEFWHFNQGDAYDAVLSHSGRPARYGAVDYDAATGSLAPIADPTRPLHSTADIEAITLAALARAGAPA